MYRLYIVIFHIPVTRVVIIKDHQKIVPQIFFRFTFYRNWKREGLNRKKSLLQ
jgi:hypothetical protein